MAAPRPGSGRMPLLAKMLRRGAQRMLDAATVERVDRLELVQGDDDRSLPFRRNTSGQREQLVGQARDVALRSDQGKGDREAPGAGARAFRFEPDFGPRRRDDGGQ